MDEPRSYKRLRWFVKAAVILLALCLGGPLVIKRWVIDSPPQTAVPTASPIVSHERPLEDRLRSLVRIGKKEDAGRFFTVYRWQDKEGIWHYSDHPRSGGTSESVVMDRTQGMVALPVRKMEPLKRITPVKLPPSPAARKTIPRNEPEDPYALTLNPLHIKAKALEAKAAMEGYYEQQRQVIEEGTPP